MVESDLEGPWVRADHAFDAVSRLVPGGERVFRVLSSYDDIRFFLEKAPGYEPGDTLMLVAPILLAHGVDDRSLTEVARVPENTGVIPGAVEAIRYLRDREAFYLISTSYSQYVAHAAEILGVPLPDTYSTSFPVDELRGGVDESDVSLVRQWTGRIAGMPDIEMDSVGGIREDCVEYKELLDEFFWDILPETSFATIMEGVRPVGGQRKFQALQEALVRQGKGLEEALVIGDSITDSVMLERAREAGGLALSFNGNRYSIPSSNVALLSGNCWATVAVLELCRLIGLDGLRDMIEEPGDFLQKAMSAGIDASLVERLASEFRNPGSHPRIFWVDSVNQDILVKESEAFRKKIRGKRIGSLG